METMDLDKLFGGIYRGKRVLITGHTGFKGSWLAFWLRKMGAQVYGISLAPETHPAHYELLSVDYHSIIHDINDRNGLAELIRDIDPEVVFHLAAQALVRHSYQNPSETFSTNVIGTVNVLDACRNCPSLRAVVLITTDKCYENKEWIWAYREIDALGGKDPYSASKACAEIAVAAYRNSYFHPDQYLKTHHVLMATARAGNVIGGGDWAEDRIIPDLVRASVKNVPLLIRFPHATRPWQHVLEPLSGYLLLGWRLLEGKAEYAEPWNFGPDPESNVPVISLVNEAVKLWPSVVYVFGSEPQPHEAGRLMLDSAKARNFLGWNNVWGFQDTLSYTISWYRTFYEYQSVMTEFDLQDYVRAALTRKLIWTQK